MIGNLTIIIAPFVIAITPTQAKDNESSSEVGTFIAASDQAVCRSDQGYSAAFDGRRTFVWRPELLEAIKSDAEARTQILGDVARALDRGPYSVTDKPKLPPGATANYYSSITPYWWPDPSKKNGLPYVLRNGLVNPARNGAEFDKEQLTDMSDDVRDLALAFYVSQNKKYADKAALLLRTWFIDPATRMNPNLNVAQGVPRKVTGRGYGLIEASSFSTVIEAIGLLKPATGKEAGLNEAEHKAIEQ